MNSLYKENWYKVYNLVYFEFPMAVKIMFHLIILRIFYFRLIPHTWFIFSLFSLFCFRSFLFHFIFALNCGSSYMYNTDARFFFSCFFNVEHKMFFFFLCFWEGKTQSTHLLQVLSFHSETHISGQPMKLFNFWNSQAWWCLWSKIWLWYFLFLNS